MGSTTETPFLSLPLFSDGDRPTWRGDINGANNSVDEFASSLNGRVGVIESDYVTSQAFGISLVKTLDVATIQAALNSANANNTRAIAAGTLTTNQTLNINCDADFSQLQINYNGTGTAVIVGDETSLGLYHKTVRLPMLTNINKSGVGWSSVAGSIGCLVKTCNDSIIYGRYTYNFESGLVLGGYGGGNSYNEYHLGNVVNNKINVTLVPGNANGWSNQNVITGGRCVYLSSEGSKVVGTKSFYIPDNPAHQQNGWVVQNVSFEGDTAEHHLECHGAYFRFTDCRFETSASVAPVVYWGTNSTANIIIGGYGIERLTEIFASTTGNSISNRVIRTRGTSWIPGQSGMSPTWAHENSSTGYPVDAIYPTGTRTNPLADLTAVWVARRSAILSEYKNASDAYSRFTIDHYNGLIKFGAGTAAPTSQFSYTIDGITTNVPLVPISTSTITLGSTNRRWNTTYTDAIDLGSGVLLKRGGLHIQGSVDGGNTWVNLL